jgi:hypothetical protein
LCSGRKLVSALRQSVTEPGKKGRHACKTRRIGVKIYWPVLKVGKKRTIQLQDAAIFTLLKAKYPPLLPFYWPPYIGFFWEGKAAGLRF